MGTNIPNPFVPDPVDAGDACSICWGVGKPFGDLETPSVVIIEISGVNKAGDWVPAMGEPVNDRFALGQSVMGACQWIHNVAGVQIEYRFDAFNTFVTVNNAEGFTCFLAGNDDACTLNIENELVAGFVGGTAKVTIPEVNE